MGKAIKEIKNPHARARRAGARLVVHIYLVRNLFVVAIGIKRVG